MEENNSCCQSYKHPKFFLKMLGMVLLAVIIVVSIVRDRIVNPSQNQVTVTGQGRVEYQPDEATVTLGVRVEKVNPADAALNQLNEKMGKITEAVKALGIGEQDIKTGAYTLIPQYDFKHGVSSVAGYNASESLIIKVRDIQNNPELTGKVISAASAAGANDVDSVNFSVSNINELKQQARLKAISDAKAKSQVMFQAAGVKAGKTIGWYENFVQSPDNPTPLAYGMGGSDMLSSKAPAAAPQVPSGTQEIVVEIGLNYEVK